MSCIMATYCSGIPFFLNDHQVKSLGTLSYTPFTNQQILWCRSQARNQRGFGRTPLFTNPPPSKNYDPPPPDLNISNSISRIVFQVGALMSMSSVFTSIQHNFYDRLLGLLLTALRTPFNTLYRTCPKTLNPLLRRIVGTPTLFGYS